MVSIDDFVIKYGDDKKIFNLEKALSYLLAERKLFSNTRPYIENPWDPKENHVVCSPTTVLFVNTSDIFAWGVADGDSITGSDEADIETNDVYRLLSYVLDDSGWGVIKYACWKQQLQPQNPIIRDMKKDGVWDDFMESLPAQNADKLI